MSVHPKISGMAALTICESLLLALEERGVLDKQEVHGLLIDAATTHGNAVTTAKNPEIHVAAQKVIEQILRLNDAPCPLFQKYFR